MGTVGGAARADLKYTSTESLDIKLSSHVLFNLPVYYFNIAGVGNNCYYDTWVNFNHVLIFFQFFTLSAILQEVKVKHFLA